MAFYAGKSGSVSVGGTAQKLTDWSLDYKCDPIETTNFEDGGYASHVYGIRSADISASGPYAGAAGGQPGTGDHVVFILNTGGPSFTINAVLTSVKIDQSIKDVAKISYTATSTGEFTITV
jgi:hypothetical protein